jgi:adenosylcobinamide-GDP ribazoletransferase
VAEPLSLRDRAAGRTSGARSRLVEIVAELGAAVSLLTRVPVPRVAGAAADAGSAAGDGAAAGAFAQERTGAAAGAFAQERTGAAAFGLVGAGLGIVAAVPVALAGAAHPLPAAVAALAVLALLDGGLHLDGLADTFDALAAPPGAAEAARRDPRAGAAGVVAIVAVLLLDASLLAEIAARDAWLGAAAVVAAGAVSRAVAPAWAVALRDRAGAMSALGAWFGRNTTGAAAAVALISAAVVILALGFLVSPRAGIGAASGAAAATAVAGLVVARRGQLDGDGLGALIEIAFSGVLLGVALAG